MSVRTAILKARLKEWFAFDSRILAPMVCGSVGLAGIFLYAFGSRRLSFRLMSAVHRVGSPSFVCRMIQSVMRSAFATSPHRPAGAFDDYLRDHVATSPQRAPQALANDPERLLKHLAIVIASADAGPGRGVVILKYNYTLPLFARAFDLQRIAKRYHIVLEPSWSGYCTEDILDYTLLRPDAVFVQAAEQYDFQFLNALNISLIPVPIAANWWVDYRLLSPDPTVEKDLDFVMVASWADFKRHYRFFDALQNLRRNGHRLRGACVGYPAGLTLADVTRRAEWYGVADQIEFHNYVPQSEVAKIVNRAKVNVVWSRKEGFNRVIIEGLFCDVPCLLRRGHNYGERYSYINERTGRFSSDRDLPTNLLEMTRFPWPHSPREWVRNHMTPEHSTAILTERIRQHCAHLGEDSPEGLSIKVNGLDGMKYWDVEDARIFTRDYERLRAHCTCKPLAVGSFLSDRDTGSSALIRA
jgi:glycosyltransferase involved in cell wall biosynthesis